MKYLVFVLVLVSCHKAERKHCWACLEQISNDTSWAKICDKTESEIKKLEKTYIVAPGSCTIHDY